MARPRRVPIFFDQLPLDWTVTLVLDIFSFPCRTFPSFLTWLLYHMLPLERRWKPTANSQRASSADVFAPMSEDFFTVSSIRTYYPSLTPKHYHLSPNLLQIQSTKHVFSDAQTLVKSSIVVHANSTVSLSSLLSCATLSLSLYLPVSLSPFLSISNVLPPRRADPRSGSSSSPPLLVCSQSARALRTFVSNAGLYHSLSKSIHSLGLRPGRSHLRVDWIPHAYTVILSTCKIILCLI